MKRVSNILAVVFAFAALCGCESRGPELPTPDGGDGGDTSTGLPLEFGVNIAESRAQIVEGGEGATLDELGVIGYQYANLTGTDWGTAKVTTRPNVFFEAVGNARHPQKLTLNGSFYDIEGPTDPTTGEVYSWSGNKYSFFAIYPYGDGNGSMVLSDESEPNTPYVTYTPSRSDVSQMADVMTSARKDLTATNRYVTFHMNHRLSAVDVEVCNIYEHSWQEGEGEGATTYYEDIDIEIVDLVVSFDNLHYASSKIYLDETEGQVPTEAADKTASYDLITTNEAILVECKATDDDPNYQLTADNNMSMFFIPQEQNDLSVTVDVKFKKKRPDGTYLTNDNYNYTYDENGNQTGMTEAEGFGSEFFFAEKTTKFEQSLDERFRYFVTLNFTSAAVSINIITAAQWTDKDINHEFE